MRGYIIQRDTPIWTSASRTRSVVGRLTRLHSSRRGSSLHLLLPPQLHLHRQLRLLRNLQQHLQVRLHRKLHLRLQVPLELEAKRSQHGASESGSGYSNKRSSESRQICDHVSIVSRRANNSSFPRNVRPVIIASRFSTFGSASLNT
jgi:hypothetical protein